tara:strand:- start:1349 stop:1804 length:456 start_codon:yes stop_codon:yes gene_type:complete
MSLENKIETKLSEALKNKDKNIFPTLRLVLSAIKDLKITKKMKEDTLKDEEIINILKKMIKQRNDSCEAYKKAGRDDLLNNEKKEIAVISEFLPKQLNDDETKKLCEDIIKSLKASSMKDMGKVMGTLKAKHGDVLDFSKTSQILKILLTK